MLKGLYTAAAGMLSTAIATDSLANNLANTNTVGFKNNKVNFESFPEMLMSRISSQGVQSIGGVMTGSKVHETFVDHRPGALRVTGNTFDMAIEGDGFFTVKTPSGQTYYTRAGNFTIDEEGFVTTTTGNYVQGELGNIQVNLDDGPYSVSSQGEIKAKDRVIDKLKITRFVEKQMLEKIGETSFIATETSQEIPPPKDGTAPLGYKIHNATLEESNVNPVMELVNNIQGMRLYEALQKNIHIHNETLGKAVNDVGRYR